MNPRLGDRRAARGAGRYAHAQPRYVHFDIIVRIVGVSPCHPGFAILIQSCEQASDSPFKLMSGTMRSMCGADAGCLAVNCPSVYLVPGRKLQGGILPGKGYTRPNSVASFVAQGVRRRAKDSGIVVASTEFGNCGGRPEERNDSTGIHRS